MARKDTTKRKDANGRGARQSKSRREYEAQIGNAQGGWRRTRKFKDKDGNWVTITEWGSGKIGW